MSADTRGIRYGFRLVLGSILTFGAALALAASLNWKA